MDGILIIDKPKGITSHDVVNSVRRIALTRKVGHAGTLDPFATGVLVVGFNQGTKALQFLQDEKEYDATLRFGVETDTLDSEGRVLKETLCRDISYKEMEGILASFVGKQLQIPPKYSAIKQKGIPLYKLAREGLDIDVAPREVEIHDVSLLGFDPPFVSFRIRCSSGTYIRSLARDIGIKVGCGGHLTSLRRVRSGKFGIEMAISLERLKEKRERWHEAAIGLRDALSFFEIVVDSAKAEMIRMGRELSIADVYAGTIPANRFMLTYNNGLVAVAEEKEGGRVRAIRVFNP